MSSICRSQVPSSILGNYRDGNLGWDVGVGVDAGMDNQARCEWDGMLCQMWDEMEIGIVIITN